MCCNCACSPWVSLPAQRQPLCWEAAAAVLLDMMLSSATPAKMWPLLISSMCTRHQVASRQVATLPTSSAASVLRHETKWLQ